MDISPFGFHILPHSHTPRWRMGINSLCHPLWASFQHRHHHCYPAQVGKNFCSMQKKAHSLWALLGPKGSNFSSGVPWAPLFTFFLKKETGQELIACVAQPDFQPPFTQNAAIKIFSHQQCKKESGQMLNFPWSARHSTFFFCGTPSGSGYRRIVE